MPAVLDAPLTTSPVDPLAFQVCGWLWLADRQPNIFAVEVWADGILLGETADLQSRPDVNSALALPASARTGFALRVCHSTASLGKPFTLALRSRFRDGTLSEILTTKAVATLVASAHPLGALRAALTPSALGLEIGAHALPTPGLNPFFTDSVATYACVAGRVDFLSDARALPLPDDTLDYLCSSHVIEHLSDPLAALHEWHRVLRPGGFLYLVAPDKRVTFDAPRPVTTAAHLLGNFHEPATPDDTPAHIDEFIFHTDWDKLQPGTTAVEKPLRQAASRDYYLGELHAGRLVDIHFHTFTPDSLHEVLVAAGFLGSPTSLFTLISRAEYYPPERGDGIAYLLQKRSGARSGPSHEGGSFELRHTAPAVPPLPLVCPITLSPLAESIDSTGRREFNAANGSHHYHFDGTLPSLLPPLGVRPLRPWKKSA